MLLSDGSLDVIESMAVVSLAPLSVPLPICT
jgi:hypothetical protein